LFVRERCIKIVTSIELGHCPGLVILRQRGEVEPENFSASFLCFRLQHQCCTRVRCDKSCQITSNQIKQRDIFPKSSPSALLLWSGLSLRKFLAINPGEDYFVLCYTAHLKCRAYSSIVYHSPSRTIKSNLSAMCIQYDPYFTWCQCAGRRWIDQCQFTDSCGPTQSAGQNIHTFCDVHARVKWMSQQKSDKTDRMLEEEDRRREEKAAKRIRSYVGRRKWWMLR
jgi:hypothetical protein